MNTSNDNDGRHTASDRACMECIISVLPSCVCVYNSISLKRIFSRQDKKGAIIIFAFVCAWLLYNSFRQILCTDRIWIILLFLVFINFFLFILWLVFVVPNQKFQVNNLFSTALKMLVGVVVFVVLFFLSVPRGRHVLNARFHWI